MHLDRKLALFIFAGLAFGALVGSSIGSASGKGLLGLGSGALAGVFLGWFVAVAVAERTRTQKK